MAVEAASTRPVAARRRVRRRGAQRPAPPRAARAPSTTPRSSRAGRRPSSPSTTSLAGRVGHYGVGDGAQRLLPADRAVTATRDGGGRHRRSDAGQPRLARPGRGRHLRADGGLARHRASPGCWWPPPCSAPPTWATPTSRPTPCPTSCSSCSRPVRCTRCWCRRWWRCSTATAGPRPSGWRARWPGRRPLAWPSWRRWRWRPARS